MRFTCPNCGARFGSADEPTSGRVYSIRCRCGTKLTLAGAAPPAPSVATGRYDPYAASHGLLLDEAQARSLAAGQPILEPVTRAVAGEEVEVTVTFSTVLAPPRAEKAERKEKIDGSQKRREAGPRGDEEEAAPVARPAGRVPPAWSAPAAALLAFVLAGGATAWFLLPQAGVKSPQALLARLHPFAAAQAGAPPEAGAPQGDPTAPPPPQAAAEPEAAPQALPRPADSGPRRLAGKTAAAQRGKFAAARERKLARRSAVDRR